jgi:hypothetical protein
MAGAKKAFVLLPVFGATVVLAAGCGGGGGSKSSSPTAGTTTAAAATTSAETSAPLAKAAYVSKMRVIGKSLSTSISSLTAATTPATAATALEALRTDLRHAADRIESLTPPDAVKAQHAQLAKAVRDFADELGPVVAQLKAGNLQALSTFPTLKGYQEIQTASTAIVNKGYKIGG